MNAFEADGPSMTCAVVMPTVAPRGSLPRYAGDEDHFNHVLEHLLEPAVRAAKLEPIAACVPSAVPVNPELAKQLEHADLVLFDLSLMRPHVLFAAGVRTALNRPSCFVRDSVTTHTPFDSAVVECLEYAANLVPWTVEDQVERLRRHIERAQQLLGKSEAVGIPQVCLQGGRRKQIERIDAEIEAAAAVIDTLARAAAARGIRVLLEMPHVWDLYYDVDRSKQMLSHLRSDNVGVLVDSTHWHTSGYDIDDYVGFLGERLWHVHLRDAAGRDTAAGNFQLEKTPGRGEVDFAALGEALDKHGYRGEVTLETEYKNYGSPDEVDEENLFALDHLRRVGWGVDAEA